MPMSYELRCPLCGSGPLLTSFETFETAKEFRNELDPTNCHTCGKSIKPAVGVVPDT